MKKIIRFQKTDAAQQVASGLIFAPMVLDSQGDYMTAEGIKAASERFMKSGRTTAVDVNHSGQPVSAFISESLIAKGDETFPAGSWLASVKIEDPDLWNMVEGGELTGFSMEGTGSKTPTTLKGKAANLLSNVEVFSISLVKRPANKTKFAVLKSDETKQLVDVLGNLAQGVQKMTDATAEMSKRMNKALGIEDEPDDVETAIKKAEDVRKAERISFLEKKISALQDRWESLIAGAKLAGSNATEAKIREQIEDAELELVALGKSESATLDSANAFYQRGGSSNFLRYSDGTSFDDLFGVTTPDQISKNDQPLDSNTMGISDLDESDVDLGSIKL